MSGDEDDREAAGRPADFAGRLVAFVLGAALASAVLLWIGRSAEPEPPADQVSSPAPGETPFYNVGKRTRGPLTLAELQISIPKELDAQLTPRMRECFLEKVEQLAAEAGDPATLDPADVAFLPRDGTWDKLTFHGRRSLLAQAIVSRAATLCF